MYKGRKICKYFLKIILENINIIIRENLVWKEMKMNKNKQKISIYENYIIANLKKYYNIDDHSDLLKFIKKNNIHHH